MRSGYGKVPEEKWPFLSPNSLCDRVHDVWTSSVIWNINFFKVLLRRKFLSLFPSFFNINLFYRFKIIQIAKNLNLPCVRGLEISVQKVRKYRPPAVCHYTVRKTIAREISAKWCCVMTCSSWEACSSTWTEGSVLSQSSEALALKSLELLDSL